jgi:hypothetical protein
MPAPALALMTSDFAAPKTFGNGNDLAQTIHALITRTRPNQNNFLLLKIPVDEANPATMFWREKLSSIKSRFHDLS